MDNKLDRIAILFEKSYFGTITFEEQQELEGYLTNKYLQQVYTDLMNNNLIKAGFTIEESFSSQKAFLEFKRKIGVSRRHIPFYKRWAVAVAVLLLFPLAYGIIRLNKTTSDAGQTVKSASLVFPGSKQAEIRLASGERVAVSDKQLQLEEQGGTQITYKDGKIEYKSEQSSPELVFNELIVPLGGECYLLLDDGTKVWVNADTKMTYPVKFIGKERRIRLEGEAYFDVKPDTKPFIVETGLGEVTVLGTTFAVRAYQQEDMMATLVSGKVRYTGTRTVEVHPGEQVVAVASGGVAKRVVDVQEYVGWKEGVYVFNKRDLESIMKDLVRWYDVEVVFAEPRLKKISFSGYLKRYDTINAFLGLLHETNEINYLIRDKQILLY